MSTTDTRSSEIESNKGLGPATDLASIRTNLLTIFSIVKPFEGIANVHQRNALSSWTSLGNAVRIVLFFDTQPPEDIEKQFECHRVEKLNEFGTPLLDCVFSRMSMIADSPYMMYSNSDILFDEQLIESVLQLRNSELKSFLGIGRRVDMNIDSLIKCSNENWIEELRNSHTARRASIVCKDYFVFTQGHFESLPPFAVGRGNWDNWMVHFAKMNRIPVVDLSDRVVAIHQNHDYDHVDGGRLSAYVNGEEARENERLANGRNLIQGSTANWKLTQRGLQKERLGSWRFWKDIPNFLMLMRNLLFFRG